MGVKVQRFLDRVGGNVLANVFSLFKSTPVEKPQKILLVNLWGMGDAVLTLPLITEIRERFGVTSVDVLATKRVWKIYKGQPGIRDVLLLEDRNTFRRRKYYDLVIDTEQYLNSSALASWWLGKGVIGYDHGQRRKLYSHTVSYNDRQHMVHTYFDLLRVKFPDVQNPDELLKVKYSKEDTKKVTSLLEDNGITKDDFIVGFCVSTAESCIARRWPKEKFAALADQLVAKYNAKIVIVGAPNERPLNQEVIDLMKHSNEALNAGGKTSVEQSLALIDSCNLFVSNDTGPMHIGAAQGVPTVGLFGPNTPVRYGPYGKKNKAVYKPVLSEPCINVHLGKVPDCEGHGHMKNISVDDVMEEVGKILAVGSHPN